MTSALKRRALFARFRGGPPQLRPPWAKAENDFTEACTQCGKCVAACPTGLVGTGHAGYPIVDFANAHCTFCGSCAAACAEGCFVTSREGRPWHLGARISKACVETKGVTCRMCEAACDASAIRFSPRLGGGSTVFVRLDDCTGCGACIATCPVRAISIAETSPALEAIS